MDYTEIKEVADNQIPEIAVPEYKERDWMHGANLDYLIDAMNGIQYGFNWLNTKEGYNYWLDMYTKLYIMKEHLKVFLVLQRIS